MKTKITLIALFSQILNWANASAQCANNANVYSFTYNSKNYEVVKELKNWNAAAACAVQRGGYLVEINDVNEQNAVYAAISNAGVSSTYTAINDGGGIAYVWIGATDKATEGIWLWDGNGDNIGTHFWSGKGYNGTGMVINGLYSNWGGSSNPPAQEPDDNAGGIPSQDCGAIGLTGWPAGTTAFGIAGEWNDIVGTSLCYYIIEKNNTVGINDVNKSIGLNISPNPCTDKLVVEGTISEKSKYELYDMTGKLVWDGILDDTKTINTHGLDKGLYYLKIENNNATSLLKFSKN
jgi:hypothetical protein